MAKTIHVKDSDIATKIETLKTASDHFKDHTVNAIATFQQVSEELSGDGYDKLIQQINNQLSQEKLLVAECLVLSEQLKKFIEEIERAESSVSF